MDNLKNTISQLKSKGYRFSAVRNVILESLSKNKRPLSVFDLQELLKTKKLLVNKTTVYRELSSLKKEEVILELQLKGNKRWYELSARNHHHHIICVRCDRVEDFAGCNSEKLINDALKQAPNFAQITSHNFDFFGLCKSCDKK